MVTPNLIYNSASRGSDVISDQDLLEHQVHTWNTSIDAGKTIIHIKKSSSLHQKCKPRTLDGGRGRRLA